MTKTLPSETPGNSGDSSSPKTKTIVDLSDLERKIEMDLSELKNEFEIPGGNEDYVFKARFYDLYLDTSSLDLSLKSNVELKIYKKATRTKKKFSLLNNGKLFSIEEKEEDYLDEVYGWIIKYRGVYDNDFLRNRSGQRDKINRWYSYIVKNDFLSKRKTNLTDELMDMIFKPMEDELFKRYQKMFADAKITEQR